MRLKTKIWIVFILFFISKISFAQSYYKFGFEIIGGTNYSYYSESGEIFGYPTYEGRFAFNVGGGFKYRLSKIFALGCEIIYSNKIFQTITNANPRHNIRYIDIPILLQFNFTPNWDFKTLIYFGPYLSILIKNNLDYYSTYQEWSFKPENTDYGLLFGVGFGIPIDNLEMGIHIRYHLGIKDMGQSYTYIGSIGGISIRTLYVESNLSSLILLLKLGFNFIQIND